MAETTLQLGFVPKNRGEYQSTPVTRYYKDNVVQYNGSSYIADPVGWSESDPTATYVTVPPTDASGNLNAGWRVFASGNNTFTTGEKVDNVGIDDEPTVGSNNLVKSGGVYEEASQLKQKVNNFDALYSAKAFAGIAGKEFAIDTNAIPIYQDGAYIVDTGVIYTNANHRLLAIDVSGVLGLLGQVTTASSVAGAVVKLGNDVLGYIDSSTTGEKTLNFGAPLPQGAILFINIFKYASQAESLQNIKLKFVSQEQNEVLDIHNGLTGSKSFHIGDLPIRGFVNTSGTITEPYNTPWYSSDFISVVPSTKIQCLLTAGNNLVGVAFYSDADESAFISCDITANTGNEAEINVPATATYFRFSTRPDKSPNSWITCQQLGTNSKRMINLEKRVTILEESQPSVLVTSMKWISIGDSITWLDGNKQGVQERPDHGYQWYLQQRITFGEYENQGISGATMMDYAFDSIHLADIYTIALGINDWSNTDLNPVGTLADYKQYKVTTGSGEYATVTNYAEGLSRMIIKIGRITAYNNIKPFIILFTPRRANKYIDSQSVQHMPDTSVEPNNAGIYLHQFADLVKEVAAFEGFPVVDLYYQSGVTDANLPALCYDVCLHPNDRGMQLIANMLYPQMEKVIR